MTIHNATNYYSHDVNTIISCVNKHVTDSQSILSGI